MLILFLFDALICLFVSFNCVDRFYHTFICDVNVKKGNLIMNMYVLSSFDFIKDNKCTHMSIKLYD